ncbi:titin isoform X1 [Lates calcarifer]|uniref:Titin isoform X1 n=1 Tax=Lates calcarifer TaxID=8187 RepID=A0AAJ7PXT2_LATCA|nr:titin isoform X1 [Lates calcarifer]
MTQLGDTASTCATQWKMWLIKVLGVIYFTAVCAAEDVTDTYRNVPPTSPVPEPTTAVYEPPTPSLHLQSTWLEVFPSEKVELYCNMTDSSDWTINWHRNGVQVKNSDPNVTFSAENSILMITEASNTHSGNYSCKGQHKSKSFSTQDSNSLSITVNENKLKPTLSRQPNYNKMFPGETVTFTCRVDIASGWEFLWYHNENEIAASNTDTYMIKAITLSNSGQYHCKAKRGPFYTEKSDPMSLQVSANDPISTISKNPAFDPMYVGEKVTFTCSVDVDSDWKYQWYKDGEELPSSTEKTLIKTLRLSDMGNYSCIATRGATSTAPSEEMLQVYAIPQPFLKPETPWLDVFPTEGVKLSCEMDSSSGWKYIWSKDKQRVEADDTVSFGQDGATLSILSASAKHKGNYTCEGHLQDRSVSSSPSFELSLTVYDEKPRVTLTQYPEYTVMFPEESVFFSCHIIVSSGWEYQWYKDGAQLSQYGNSHNISFVGTKDTGSYTCQVKRGRDMVFKSDHSQAVRLKVEEKRPKPVMTQDPNDKKVYAGETLSFECKVEISSGWEYHWYKDNTTLQVSGSSFKISSASSSNNGNYMCMAKRDKSMYHTEHSDGQNLQISEIPVPSLKLETPWLDVFPTERVNFSCGMEDNWIYTWYKDGKPIHADGTVSTYSDGATLNITSAAISHSGQYSCSGKLNSKTRSVTSHTSPGVTLSVYDTKPKLTLMQNPDYDVMYTEDSVFFSCHINVSSGWEYLWYKNGAQLSQSGNSHNISLQTKDTGSYTCQARRGTDTVFLSDQSQQVVLDVKERPQAKIILLTGWSEVFSTDSLVLQCAVQDSQDTWNYTWSKETEQINQLPSERHTVTPQNDPDQSLYTCQGIRAGRPSYSKHSDSFKTKNLLLKRRVLLSISGCLFFGLIAVLLGCIALRFFRKPVAGDEDNPEESNLFLTMAQLKNRSDAPCPLVQYITDASLNDASKEGDENGTVCNETTPLPITTEEDQAVTTDSHETEENGGLVSFK